MPKPENMLIIFVVFCCARLSFAEKSGVSSEAYDVARATLSDNKKAHKKTQAEYDKKEITIVDDRVYLGKIERRRLSHQTLYREVGLDELYNRVKRRTRYKYLMGYIAAGMIVGGIGYLAIRGWQVFNLQHDQDFFDPDPPEDIPSHKSYLIPAGAITGVGLLVGIYANSYTADKTTAVERIDMVREHNEGLKHRFGLASADTSRDRSATSFDLRILPMISVQGGGIAVSLRY